jgi:hypothetical protein
MQLDVTLATYRKYLNEVEVETGMIRIAPKGRLLSSIGDTHKILNTRDLSQINLVYNNITYPTIQLE